MNLNFDGGGVISIRCLVQETFFLKICNCFSVNRVQGVFVLYRISKVLIGCDCIVLYEKKSEIALYCF